MLIFFLLTGLSLKTESRIEFLTPGTEGTKVLGNIPEYSPSRVKTRSYFKSQPVYRCEVQEMRRLNYFFEIFYCNLHYYKRLMPKFMNISV